MRAGLNPHAGEHGLMGREDDEVIAPAVVDCRAAGIDVIGPLPADTVAVRARRGEFDVVVACYHDQGLVPVKLVAFGRSVNVTLGLPIVRTSVDHGPPLTSPVWELPIPAAWPTRCSSPPTS